MVFNNALWKHWQLHFCWLCDKSFFHTQFKILRFTPGVEFIVGFSHKITRGSSERMYKCGKFAQNLQEWCQWSRFLEAVWFLLDKATKTRIYSLKSADQMSRHALRLQIEFSVKTIAFWEIVQLSSKAVIVRDVTMVLTMGPYIFLASIFKTLAQGLSLLNNYLADPLELSHPRKQILFSSNYSHHFSQPRRK